MKILITGGAGYIGSSVAACCADNVITPVILDDYSKGLREFAEPYLNYEGDIADVPLIRRILSEHPDIDAVIHCAAKIVVPESVSAPLDYYENNVSKTLVLLRELCGHGVRRFILSSTGSMYEGGDGQLVDESSAVVPHSPYSASKWMLERMLRDLAATGAMEVVALRYFNPIGADPKMRSGLQDERPTHALGKMIEAYQGGGTFTVTGTDWPTRDGSGLRDYVHVWDLARAHIAALECFDSVMLQAQVPGFDVINLGSGRGTTVFELVDAFGDAMGVRLDMGTAPARLGDVVGCATLTGKAERLLGWNAELSISDGVRHSLEWAARLPAVLERERARAAGRA
ncbi:UDP-glucose 4-epimerase GalE [Propionibacterium freudenreichii]|uniref:UDP-glucose 4-epimerase n=1 Tax=Propionibacterium freudenreichii subsp. freudenreichii TaxID=66712 RepID=A0A0B7NUZ0_PROFF|nr:UDP-glucose 4-epimerase GalE [Propionibacterium freudenreichii]CEP26516.1 UDP-glucose 4-epimerase [Propionibacterium freudenreichii subsp. freudenreichii]MCT2995149.1 UDP-glucose 4-epimerase GalE [Propionibacterium freudenreichii]MDK9352790.1 UDP-glucose 4-epimerase GalE [Propionibacterium freudenreichii]MDK9645668.1 UDP-glucose 4-epimerase GalE [Propionibacterium freudenreichii]MDK9656050.1 UDP-glucose 4-epimerase GalE [Propionibacterium freudenreichii]